MLKKKRKHKTKTPAKHATFSKVEEKKYYCFFLRSSAFYISIKYNFKHQVISKHKLLINLERKYFIKKFVKPAKKIFLFF